MNMEKYRRTLIIRRRLLALFMLLLILPGLVLGVFLKSRPADGFAAGFAVGVPAGALIAAAAAFIKAGRGLKDEAELKKMYIRENDERERLIGFKTGSSAIICCAMVLVPAMLAAVFINMTVFRTLTGVIIFMFISVLGFRTYYNKKY